MVEKEQVLQEVIPKTMKAAVMNDTFDIEVKELAVPELNPDEVLIKVMAVGICGSDIHYYEHGKIGPYVVESPIILGHECAGVVVKIGEEVTRHKVGDRVAVEPGITCGTCEYCKAGRYNLCPEVEFLATPPVDGAFVQYFKHRDDFVHPIPDDLSFEEGAFIEPFSVGIHAAKRTQLQPGSTVAIMGMGPVGLTAVAAVKAFGAKKVIVTDLSPVRLEAAKKMGADHIIHATEENVDEKIQEITGGKGVDTAFETAGNPKALQSALAAVKRGGKLAIVGLPPINEIAVNVPLIADNEIDICGIFRYVNTYPQGIEFLSSKLVDMHELITDRFPLERTWEAMEKARTDKQGSIKVMVYPNGLPEY
ncbi:NAD(P)-dependent alcohol dehydrogenase [Thalassobacillus pellis]|uniref:NAD(P)-dependent alcohol dehydrogenase n=1 Tax=Thalassobacillus pellis TaxID=748008 RepID=UPI001EF8E33E|nr:NAD(P)-dependent alcohol dehydrogenase [Thalassobacillus pellis]MBM7553235.1 L-iditol 2-dehydrogenase [Thalassobacillus pellis]